jgi:hypothetical protein
MNTGIIRLRSIGQLTKPTIIADEGDAAARRFLEFFTANIRNANTQAAYAQAVGQFLRWCQLRRSSHRDIEPMAVAAYIESHSGSDPAKKQHLAAAAPSKKPSGSPHMNRPKQPSFMTALAIRLPSMR